MSEPIRIFVQYVPGGRPLEVGVFQPPADVEQLSVYTEIARQHAAWDATCPAWDKEVTFAHWLCDAGWTKVPSIKEHVIWFKT